MLTSCNTKPQRGVTMVASRFNGWYKAARKRRAFRYATSNPCRVPTARYPSTSSLPAIEMAGYHCLMPTASLPKLQIICTSGLLCIRYEPLCDIKEVRIELRMCRKMEKNASVIRNLRIFAAGNRQTNFLV